MRLTLIMIALLTACQAAPDAPQNFDDLLKITDTTSDPICTLPLAELRENIDAEALEEAKAKAFSYETVIETYSDDPAAQITVIFRRAALKRRLSALGDTPEVAQQFYDSFDVPDAMPTTLTGFHDRYHYWMDRIAEQGDFGEQDSAPVNLRFCVMNEARAALHAASRADIIERVAKGVSLPAPDLVENINHEATFDNAFTKSMLAQIYTADNVTGLSPLERAQMRGREAILPFDPKRAELFWEMRDEEVAAILAYIESHNFETPADKLKHMTNIDQSLRKMWNPANADIHFENAEEFGSFKKGVSERVMKVDTFNTAELTKMLEGRGWFRDDKDGSGAANDAWLIAQHADLDPDFQAKALTMIEAEFDAPGVSKRNYAYLYDRVQMRFSDDAATERKLQRYGTQGRCTGPGTWEPFPIEEPDRIDEVRADVGLGTMEAYKSRFKTICTKDQR